MTTFADTCARARAATRALAITPRAEKDAALLAAADALVRRADAILAANAADVEAARARGTSAALLDRLGLDARRLEAVARSVREIAAQDDPVGQVLEDRTRPNGLRVRRVRVPIGVIGDDLRGAPERHRRGGGALLQVRQRGRAPRRVGCAPHQRGDRRRGARRSPRTRAATPSKSSLRPRTRACSRWCAPRARSISSSHAAARR